MRPVCKSGGYPANGSDENNTFAKFSPSGSLELTVANPALIGTFEPGETYYLEFTKEEEAPTLDQIFNRIKAAIDRGKVAGSAWVDLPEFCAGSAWVDLPEFCLMDIYQDSQVEAMIELIRGQITKHSSGRVADRAYLWDLVAVEVLRQPISKAYNPNGCKGWVRIYTK
jgi:hypothetical protein